MPVFSTSDATFSARGLSVISSVTTLTGTSASFSEGTFNRYNLPPAWNTMSDGPAAGNVTSTSVNVVTWRATPVFESSAQIYARSAGPRSVRK